MKKKPLKIVLTMLARPTLFLLLALALAPAVARAQTPQYMSYQGYLTDGNGNALGSTNTGPKAYDVVFRIWDLPAGGTIGTADDLFAELQTVTVDNGYFSVLLGQGTSYQTEPHGQLSGVFTGPNAPRYVEMTVLGIGVGNAPVTILPRLQLVYAPYAFSAVNVTGNNVITAANLSTNLGLWQANGPNIYFNSGNVGIGTPSPTARLQAQGNGNNTVNLFAGDRQPFGTAGFETWFSTPQTHIYCSEGAGNTNVFNVSAGGRAYLAGNLTFADVLGDKVTLWDGYGFGVSNATLQIHADLTSSDIAFGTGSSTNMNETMRIKGTGNVGIGTPSPAAKLDVRGDVSMQGGVNGTTVFATGSTEDLRIIRGSVVPGLPGFNVGTGFTVSSNNVGLMQINFNQNFASTAVVVASPARYYLSNGPLPYTVIVSDPTQSGVQIQTFSGSTPANIEFNFIAIGGR